MASHLMTQRRPSAPASRNLSTVYCAGPRLPLRVVARGAVLLPRGTSVYHPSTYASPCSGAPFSVALLNAFVLILSLLFFLLMTIMGTLLVTNHSPGCHTRFSLSSVTELASWYIEGGFLPSLFWLGLFAHHPVYLLLTM